MIREGSGKTIKELINRGVITPVNETSDWCSPAFFVLKGDNIRVRLVTDYTELNTHVNRLIHLFGHTLEILQAIPPEAKFFAKMDAVHGYFQLGLDEESSHMTTFLLPQGKFCYLRAPMGLNASSDECCCHSDVIIRGLPWARKIVDDTLAQAPEPELLDRARLVLQRCRENNIIISQKKLELSNKIKFSGHIISNEGYGLDHDKFTVIANFPHPKNLRDLRVFIGLANQLGMFIPELAHMTSPLRPLMKRDVAWLWLQEHEDAFMNANRLYGIGFALFPKSPDGNNISLIQCGSCSLCET